MYESWGHSRRCLGEYGELHGMPVACRNECLLYLAEGTLALQFGESVWLAEFIGSLCK